MTRERNQRNIRWYAPILVLLMTALTGTDLPAQSAEQFSFDVMPGAVIPLGASTELYEFGFGAGLNGRYLPGDSPFFLGGGVAYGMIPTQAGTSVTLLDAGLGTGVLLQPGQAGLFDVEVGMRIGGYVSLYRATASGNPHAQAYGMVRFRVGPAFTIGAGSSYGYYSDFDATGSIADPFFQGLGAFLSARWSPGASNGQVRPNLEIGPPAFDRIFPVLYRFYDENPLGAVTLINKERRAIENVEVSFYVPQYMEAAQVIMELPTLNRDEELTVSLEALFREGILGVTETTSVQAQVIVSYDLADARLTTERTETLQIQNRNQMTWDDDRKAAAFVTAGDPTVQRLSRNVTAVTRSLGNVAVNERLRNAMAIHEALNLYGLEYVIDPDSSYIELSENENALDYLQFPVQTLDFRAGDCDDLSILYASLYEAIGIPTAFVTIPGHIFIAVDLGMSEEEARRTFAKPEDLVFRDGSTWLPIETTVTGEDFLRAWSVGAKQYRENDATDTVGFFPVRRAWRIYPPTGFSSQALDRSLPDERQIAEQYGQTLVTFVGREIAPQV